MTQAGRLTIDHEDHGSPLAQELIAELMADIDVRYAGDPGPDDEALFELTNPWRVETFQVTPPAGAFGIARLDCVPVACGAVRRIYEGPADVAEVKRMYTRPAARRRGVSRALLAWLECQATALGYRRIHLETGLRQPEAIALYETAGYERIPPYGDYPGDPRAVCFGKDLAHSRSSGPGGPERTYHSQP
jgi:GNAT superfamily N-acetyltransferase